MTLFWLVAGYISENILTGNTEPTSIHETHSTAPEPPETRCEAICADCKQPCIFPFFIYPHTHRCDLLHHWPADTEVVRYRGEAVLLDAPRMVIGRPYPLIWRSKPAIAIKQTDGSVEFLRDSPRAGRTGGQDEYELRG